MRRGFRHEGGKAAKAIAPAAPAESLKGKSKTFIYFVSHYSAPAAFLLQQSWRLLSTPPLIDVTAQQWPV
jgi:hypothetical protein